MPDTIDINISPVIETVALTIQPNLTTINVNTITGGGGAVTSVNTLVGDVVLTQDTILDGSTFKQYSLTEKNKLAGIATGAEVNVNADWNATTGDALILNKPTIPAAVTQTSQLTNNGADGVNPFITALDIPTTGQASTIVREVKNMTGATLTKGTVVYISGANGNKALVSKALATTDALSSRTFGLLQSNISNNGLGYCVIIGDLSGLDTSTFTEGDQLYLSGVTAGTYTATKILAPTHLVYVGKVTRSHPTQGQIEVGIQNGYELAEIHDVALSSVANNQLLSYDSATSLWKNKSVTTADIASSTNKNYVTDAQATIINNTSGTNTGDNSTNTNSNSYADAKVSDTITDGVTTIAPSQNAVFDALALKQSILSYTPYKNLQTSQTAITATVAETVVFTATIPAGSFNSTDVIKVLFGANKTTALGTFSLRLRINTTNTIVGAPLIGLVNATATAQCDVMMRNFNLNGGNLHGLPFGTSAITDITAVGGALSSTPLNPANTFYIFGTVQLANLLDSIVGNMLSIHN